MAIRINICFCVFISLSLVLSIVSCAGFTQCHHRFDSQHAAAMEIEGVKVRKGYCPLLSLLSLLILLPTEICTENVFHVWLMGIQSSLLVRILLVFSFYLLALSYPNKTAAAIVLLMLLLLNTPKTRWGFSCSCLSSRQGSFHDCLKERGSCRDVAVIDCCWPPWQHITFA